MIFKDRVFINPRQRKFKDMATGEIHTIELQDDYENIEIGGTPIDAFHLNKLADATQNQSADITGTNFGGILKVNGNPVIESGSNANGSYTKYYDGTMIISQFYSLSWTEPMASYGSSFYKSFNYPTHIKPYPIPFISAPTAIVGVSYSNGWGGTAGSNNLVYPVVSIYVYSPVQNTTGTANINVIAIGRWKI